MNIEEFDKWIDSLPKIKNNNYCCSTIAVDVDELRKTVKRFKKIPSFDELSKENNKLIKEKEELIDYLKEKIKLCKKAQVIALKNKMIEQIGNFNLRIATYEEILSKMEKRQI